MASKNSRVEFWILSCVTLKLDGRPWKTIGHLFSVTSSFVHHFITIGASYSPETPNLDQNQFFFAPCNLGIWRMTLKNNRTPLLCYFKLCASFPSHRWIQTRVTVRKRPIRVNIGDLFCPMWPWNLTDDIKTKGHLFCATASVLHHFVAICGFKLELQFGNAQIGAKIFWTLCSWPLTSELDLAWTSLLSMVITPENCMMITPENCMIIRWKEHCEKGVTDKRTDRRTDGRKCS